jgi:Xaa-Pro aminopeptidase
MGTILKGMVLAIEPGIYWPGGGGLRLEDNFLITDKGNEKLCAYPDDFRLART